MLRFFRLNKNAATALLFLFPALVILVFVRIVPSVQALLTSFQFRGEFVGLDNYAFILNTPRIVDSIITTLVFNVIVNPLQIGLALILALILVDRVALSSFWRVLIFMPVAVPLSVASIVWGIAMRPDDGMLNAFLNRLGIASQPFLTSPDQALFSIMFIASWAGVGYWMIFLISGLKEIPESLKEAAQLDGAGYWRILFSITLPMLRRTLAFVLVADTIANFLLFPPVQILTRGGPGGSTNLIMFEIYRNAFSFNDLELAYALMVVLLLILMVIVSIQFKLLQAGEPS